MKKTIYLYINDKDKEVLNEFFSEYEVSFLDDNKEELINIPTIGEGIKRFYLKINGKISIEYQPSYFAINRLQAAFFRYDSSKFDTDKFFNILKKYIRNNFIITTSRGEYFGLNMYKDWEERKYCFPGIFFYSEVHVENDKIKEVFDEVKKLGFEVKANRIKLRNSEHIDFTEEYYVIFSEESELSRTIFRKTTVIYEYGSECIFVEYDLKKKKYCFYLDHRIILDKKSKLINLYNFIEKKYGVNKGTEI